ncbi:AfsR/SARP family transcriptional regulator [Umezawaea tangerina]|uniref:DNA-binding SARP family transcriptional activator n=1 Tax=Umezawaea tangerina TaxID=84725 RepID=A0A2T0SP41_9PSEU|nr:AfsR/SARP family transcriptional regulator [Umezawaea tangerina]PRY35184.1 DNA-binding SARP family transcriptional activator [Umezawaea tangerina]
MRFALLGHTEIHTEIHTHTHTDTHTPVLGDLRRAILALLLLRANEFVSRDRLIDECWRDRSAKDPVNALHLHVAKLRTVLGTRLETRSSGYRLTVLPGELDVDVFGRLHRQGRELVALHRFERASEVLREADAVWRGPALADVADAPSVAGERARLTELRLGARELAVEADLALRRHAELVPELTLLVAENPLRERLSKQLMLALYRCGRQAEALAVYDSARRRLAESSGLDPLPGLRELHKAVLRQDGALTGGLVSTWA